LRSFVDSLIGRPAPFDSFTLQPDEVKTTWTQSDVTVDASAPISVAQLLVGKQFVGGIPTGDPSLVLFPAVEQYASEYLVPSPASWAQSFLVLARPVGATVMLDGAAPSGCTTAPAGTVAGVAYESVTCAVSVGAHRLTGNQPFGVMAYGYSDSASYAFSAGAAL
jgi:IgGFc binding protein